MFSSFSGWKSGKSKIEQCWWSSIHTYFSLQCSCSLHSWTLPKRGLFVDPLWRAKGYLVLYIYIYIRGAGSTREVWEGPLSMRGTSCKRRHAADEGSHAVDCWNREAGDGLPEKVGTDGREKKREENNKAGEEGCGAFGELVSKGDIAISKQKQTLLRGRSKGKCERGHFHFLHYFTLLFTSFFTLSGLSVDLRLCFWSTCCYLRWL